jgi:hypothetical protein
MATAILRSSEAQLARQAETVSNTTPSGKWRELIDSLLMTCRVPNEELLPPFWHVMARTPKQQGMAVLREQLLAYSQGATRFCFQIPVVSASLYTDIMNLTFCGNHADDFATGISPFAVADGSDAHRASNLKAAEIQRAMLEGGTNMSFRDWELLGTKVKLAVPTTFLDLINSLGLFGNLLGTLFGDLHPLVDSFRSFHASASTSMYREVQQLVDIRLFVRPCDILRRIQLECYAYFQAIRVRATPDQPDFSSILRELTRQMFHFPCLPSALEQLVPPMFPNMLKLPPIPALTDSTASSSASLLSGLTPSIVTGRPPPTITTPGAGGRTPKLTGTPGRVRVVNPSPEPALARLLPAGIAIKAFIGDNPPPNNDEGAPMCLSYHLRDGCWTNCKRLQDHRLQSDGEKTRLHAFLRSRQPAPTATGATIVTLPP